MAEIEEIIDVEIPLPPGAKRKEPVGEDIPLPPGAKKKADSVNGNPDLKNGSPTSQDIEVPIADFGASQLQPQVQAEIQPQTESEKLQYSWDRPTVVVGASETSKAADQNPYIDKLETLKTVINASPAMPGVKVASETYINGMQMFLQGTDRTAKSVQNLGDKNVPKDLKTLTEPLAAIVQTAFGAASMTVPQIMIFNAGFGAAETGLKEVLPDDVVHGLISPLQESVRHLGKSVIPINFGGGITLVSADQLSPLSEIGDLVYQGLIFKGFHGLAKKFKANEPVTPEESTQITEEVGELIKDAGEPIEAKVIEKIPADLPNEKKVEVAPLVKEKINEEDKLKNTDDSFHPGIEENIERLRKEINEKIKSSNVQIGRVTLKQKDVPHESEILKAEEIKSQTKTETDAIQKPEAAESMLRNEGIRREGELSGVVKSDQPKVTTESSPEVKQQPQEEVTDIERRQEELNAVDRQSGEKKSFISDDKKKEITAIKELIQKRDTLSPEKFNEWLDTDAALNVSRAISNEEIYRGIRDKTIDEDYVKRQITTYEERVNAKYDAELAALKKKPKPQEVATPPSILGRDVASTTKALEDNYLDYDATRTLEKYFKRTVDYNGVHSVELHDGTIWSLKKLAEEYHKAKSEGSNPNLVKVIEEAIPKDIQELAEKENKPITKTETKNEKAKEASQEAEVLIETPTPEKVTEVSETTEPPLAEPPNPEMTGIRHEKTAEAREEMGIDPYERNPETQAQWEAEADRLIAEGYDSEALLKRLESGDTVHTPVEQKILERHLVALKNEFNKNPTDENINKYKLASELSDRQAGSLPAKILAARKGDVPVTDDYADMLVAKMEANKVDVLTDEQKSEVKQQFEKVKAAHEKAQEKIKELEDALAKSQAETELAKQKAATKPSKEKKTKDDYVSERKKIGEDISEKIKKIRESLSKTGAIFDPKVEAQRQLERDKILVSIVPDVARLVKSHINEVVSKAGEIKLGDIVKSIHGQLKDYIEWLTERDVHDIIAGEYRERKETRNELQAKIKDVQDEATLINKLEAFEKGSIPKTEKAKVERNTMIKELRDKLKNPEDLQKFKDRNTEKAKEYRERIAKGDFETKRKPESVIDNLEAKKNFPKLYNEALDALIKNEEAKADFDIALIRDEMAKRNKFEKWADVGKSIIATGKAITTGIDDSAIFVQNVIALIAHPQQAPSALKGHLIDFASEKNYKRWLTELHNDHFWWDLIQKSGLPITDPKSLRQSGREEAFSYNALDKEYTIMGKKINVGKYILRPFERMFTSLGNRIRVGVFKNVASKMLEQGRTWENSPEEFKSLAKVLANETGRPNLPAGLEAANSWLVPVIWSPRLLAATFNTIGLGDIKIRGNKGYYRSLTPAMQKYAAKDLAKYIGAGLGVMGILSMIGFTPDLNPISSTFGTVQTPDKKRRIPVFGRFGSAVRTIAQILTKHQSKEGLISEIPTEKWMTLPLHYMRGKLTPIVGGAISAGFGKDYTGKPTTIGKEALKQVTPISIQGIREGLKQSGMLSFLTDGIPNLTGLNISYEETFKYNVPKTVEVADKKVPLTEPQHDYFQEQYDFYKEQYINKLISTTEYENADDEGKISMRKIVDSSALSKAKDGLKKKYPSIFVETEAEKAARLKKGKEDKDLKSKIGITEPKTESNANAPTLVR